MCKSPPTTIMDSDLADAKEIKAAEESAWEILTGFSLPKYAVDSLTHYKNNPESFKNEVLSGITVAVMQVPESVAFSFVAGVPPLVAVWKSKFYGEFVLNRRVDLHAIDAALARWRGDADSSPLDGASTAASSLRLSAPTH